MGKNSNKNLQTEIKAKIKKPLTEEQLKDVSGGSLVRNRREDEHTEPDAEPKWEPSPPSILPEN